MAQKFDVASRLAEGRPAVENVQNYVWACHLLGYQHPDLTLHRTQVRDGYGTEDGLDLRALDADCAALEAAVAATQDAVTRQDDQLAAVSTAWQGRGAEAAREFLRRHGHASAAASAALRTAADALAVLRDDLWQAVDAKVAAAVAIDGQTLSQRAAWLAAAQTVTTGVGDRAAASERIDQEVKPFVDNNIRVDWLSAMRAATAAVSDAYAKVIAELRAEPDAIFDVPGDLGPSWTPPPDDVKPAAAAAPPVWSAPPTSMTAPSSAAPAAPPAPPVPVPPPPVPVPPPVDTAPMAAPPMPAMPSAGGMGGGLPDMGGGLSGFGQQLADSLGGLLGSTDDALRDPLEFDEPEDDDEDDDEHDKPEKEPTQPDEAQPAEETVAPAGEVCAPPTAGPPPVVPPPAPVEPEPAPVAVPPPPEPVVPPEPPVPADRLTATGTPCEIAADELPQAGQ